MDSVLLTSTCTLYIQYMYHSDTAHTHTIGHARIMNSMPILFIATMIRSRKSAILVSLGIARMNSVFDVTSKEVTMCEIWLSGASASNSSHLGCSSYSSSWKIRRLCRDKLHRVNLLKNNFNNNAI